MIALTHSWHNLSIPSKFIAEVLAGMVPITRANLDACPDMPLSDILFSTTGAETFWVRKNYLRVAIQLVLPREILPGLPRHSRHPQTEP
jgi:hypothetical protein